MTFRLFRVLPAHCDGVVLGSRLLNFRRPSDRRWPQTKPDARNTSRTPTVRFAYIRVCILSILQCMYMRSLQYNHANRLRPKKTIAPPALSSTCIDHTRSSGMTLDPLPLFVHALVTPRVFVPVLSYELFITPRKPLCPDVFSRSSFPNDIYRHILRIHVGRGRGKCKTCARPTRRIYTSRRGRTTTDGVLGRA